MFKSIIIQNFQSHKDSYLEFSSNVTAICGLNNHGKSAIFKALQKVVRDNPDGTTFIRDGEKECDISITTDKGIVLRKIRNDRSDEANMYIANNLPFAKFARTGIPVEVKDILDISEIQTFTDIDTDLNFQTQFDELFLIQGDGLTSKRGKILGKTTGIDIVAKAIQIAAAEERSKTIKKNDYVDELNKIESNLLLYEKIDSISEASKIVENKLILSRGKQDQLNNLKDIYQKLLIDISKARVTIKRFKILDVDLSSSFKNIETLYKIKKKAETIFLLREKIEKFSSFVEKTRIRLVSLRNMVSLIQVKIDETVYFKQIINLKIHLEKIQRRIVEIPSINNLINAYNKYGKLGDLNRKIQKIRSNIDSQKIGLRSLYKQEGEETKELDNLKQELGVCPLCQKPF